MRNPHRPTQPGITTFTKKEMAEFLAAKRYPFQPAPRDREYTSLMRLTKRELERKMDRATQPAKPITVSAGFAAQF